MGAHRYIYRDRLLRLHRRRERVPALTVDLAHLAEYDAAILGYLLAQPATLLPTLELAAVDALHSLLHHGTQDATNNNIGSMTQDLDDGDVDMGEAGNQQTQQDEAAAASLANLPSIQILLTGQL